MSEIETAPISNPYNHWLSLAFDKAEEILESDNVDEAIESLASSTPLNLEIKGMVGDEIRALGVTIGEALATIVRNLNQNKYLYSILMTCLIEKLVNPSQDIRFAQTDMEGGYSNRSTDQVNITPFLKRHRLTSCAASGAESGRNFERPFPYELDFVGKPRGEGNLQSFLGVIHAVQVEGIDPFPCIVYLMALDLRNKIEQVYEYPEPVGLTVQQIIDAVLLHHEKASGNGRARLPVLAIQAIYQCIAPEISRYESAFLRDPPNRHTGNDKMGWIGDIQLDKADGSPFEAVEVKSGRQITPDMVLLLPQKFGGRPVERYFILSTEEEYIDKKVENDVHEAVDYVRKLTACEVIVNGLNRSLWYYLRLVSNPQSFIGYYSRQIETDLDVKDEHRALWSEILVSYQK